MYKRADTLGAGESSPESFDLNWPDLKASLSLSLIEAVHVWFTARLCSILSSL